MQSPKNGSLEVDGINAETFSYLSIPSDFLANFFPHIELRLSEEGRFVQRMSIRY